MSSSGADNPLVEVHPTAQVSKLADLELSQRGTKIVVGPGSRIDSCEDQACRWLGHVLLGERCYLNSGCVLYFRQWHHHWYHRLDCC